MQNGPHFGSLGLSDRTTLKSIHWLPLSRGINPLPFMLKDVSSMAILSQVDPSHREPNLRGLTGEHEEPYFFILIHGRRI